MPISFANIPADIKVPLYWVEVDPSMAGLPTINLRALLVGVKIAAGSAPDDIAMPIGSQAQADEAFGEGSELSRMFKAFFANNFANEVWGLPVEGDRPAPSAATGMVTVTACADRRWHHPSVHRGRSCAGQHRDHRHGRQHRHHHRGRDQCRCDAAGHRERHRWRGDADLGLQGRQRQRDQRVR